MTILDARNSRSGFDMSDGAQVNFDTYLNHNNGYYSWKTTEGSDLASYIHAFGTGITADPTTSYPTAGAITSLKIDLDHDGNPSTDQGIDAQITLAAPVQLTALTSPAGTDPQAAADKFWETLLSGNDRIYGSDAGRSFLFGDFLRIFSSQLVNENKTGGDDIISAAPTSGDSTVVTIGSRGAVGSALVGDAYEVAGSAFNDIAYSGVLNGGDDTITLTNRAAYNLVGDAYSVLDLGAVHGGDDTIRSDAVTGLTGFAPTSLLAGDVFRNGGFVVGGADSLLGSNFAFLDEMISGDVWSQTGSTTGGADALQGRAGHDFMAGDVVSAGGAVTGGADTLNGGEDADIIAGDVLQAGNSGPFGTLGFVGAIRASITGGNDAITGDAGNDIIAGDIYSFGDLTADSSIRGGDDVLRGGDGEDVIYGDFGPSGASLPAGFFDDGGNDKLYGDAGSDTLVGGAGVDLLDGGLGKDVMSGGLGDDICYVDNVGDQVVEGAGQGTADLVAASVSYVLGASAQVETLRTTSNGGNTDIDLTGNSFAQTVVGNAGENVIRGGGGLDTMSGLGGGDTYFIDSADDSVIEGAGQGTADLVATSVSYALDAAVQVETLRTTSTGGTTNIGLAGNEFSQIVVGNAGANTIDGRGGNDTLTGSAGADSFVFDTALNASTNVDTITDFSVADDTIRLENAIFTAIAGTGTLTAAQFVKNTTGLAADANDRIIYETDTGKLFYDSNGNATGGSFHFATLDPNLVLTNADFFAI